MTQGLLASPRIWAVGAVALATVLTSIPYVYGALYADADHQFTGVVAWHGDVFYYLAQMRQFGTALLIANPVTPEVHAPVLFNGAIRTARLARAVDGNAIALLVPPRAPRRRLGGDSAGGAGVGGHRRPHATRAHCGAITRAVCQRVALARLGSAVRLTAGRPAVLAQDSRGEHASSRR